jgi:uncharacterized protein
MKKCKLPSREECFELIRQYAVPEHIVKHSMATAKLAVYLAERLKEKGIAVDADLVERACLLHDVARMCDFEKLDCGGLAEPVEQESKTIWQQLRTDYEGFCHEDVAYELLKGKYPELAITIRKHKYLAILDEKDKPTTWEEKLVYYADKRVMHDKIVPLRERLDEAHERHAQQHNISTQQKLTTSKADAQIFKLEEEIFNKIGLTPDEVTIKFIEATDTSG